MSMQIHKVVIASLISLTMVGCATVPLASQQASDQAKAFKAPSAGHAGLYIYRSGHFGSALTKSIWVDKQCLGKSAPNTFFYTEVSGNQQHTISTSSEFSPNSITLTTDSGKNYFVNQYIKPGVIMGGANLKVVSESKAEPLFKHLELAKQGSCD